MTTAPRVLICGASIAGPALAHWLHRYGWDVTVVERAPGPRAGGQNIDVRGAGREVARRMDLEDAIRAATTGEVGTRFVGPHGETIAELPAGTSDSGGATAELEILRGDLAELLVGSSSGAAYVWGDHVTALDDDGDGVDVTFAHGAPQRFDLVVAADGIGSSTRRLVFGDEVEIRSLGLQTAWLTIPRTASDDDWWRWFNAPAGRTITLRPDPVGTIRATLSCLTDSRDPDGSPEAQLRERFAGAGWVADRILSHLEDGDLYVDQVGQVHAPRWSSGRVVLLGDAGYCASPISGMGTSLALVGAYVLAGELAAHVHVRDGLAGYERILRPYVDQAQKLPPGAPRLAHPKTRLGVGVFRLGTRVAASRLAGALGERFSTPPAEAIELPGYAHLQMR